MKSNAYANEMRSKFLGTSAFLVWTNSLPLAPTRFVLILEPPVPLDAALLGSRVTKMRSLIPNLQIWVQPISVSVVTVGEWNMRFAAYPASAL